MNNTLHEYAVQYVFPNIFYIQIYSLLNPIGNSPSRTLGSVMIVLMF